MAQSGFFSRCKAVKNIVVLASLLIIAALCIAQAANQTPAAANAVTPVAVEANQIAPATEVPAAAEPAQTVTSVAVVMPGKAEPNEGGSDAGVLSPLEQRLRKTVSVEFRETPIADVVRQLGAQAEVDILLSPKVIGNVTATLTDVPLDEALNNILAVQGATYIAGKNMIRVVPIGDMTMEQAKMVTKVYRIVFADVKEVAAALEKFISKSGQISFSVGTSNIIVTDTEDKIKSIDTFITEIDRVTPQVLVECRIFDVTINDGFKLDIDWSAGNNPDVTSTEKSSYNNFNHTNTNTNGVITDTAEATDGTKLSKTITDTGVESTAKKTSDPFVNGGFSPASGGKIRFGWLNDNVDISFLLKILSTNRNSKLLANPRILVLDNESANIKIVQEIPYQEISQTSGGGNIGNTQFKDVGVELTVIPHITREGLIRMSIKPKFSTQVGEALIEIPDAVGSGGQTSLKSNVPVIDSREASTIAFAKDGQTIVIGGLRKQEKRQDVSKVPILGDMPLVGVLFKSNTESIKTTELVIFVTPTIVIQPVKISGDDLEKYSRTEIGSPKMGKMVLDGENKEKK